MVTTMIKFLIMILLSIFTNSLRPLNQRVRNLKNSKHLFLSRSMVQTRDTLISSLNGAQDISIKVISCRDVVQEAIARSEISRDAAIPFAELLTCSLLMASSMKGDETLQVNFVGNEGLKSLMAIADGNLHVKGMIGNPRFTSPNSLLPNGPIQQVLGEGQIQVIRSHPFWKSPITGIVALRETSITLNLSLYLAESEQRSAVLHSEVDIGEDGRCNYALGVLTERLPGCSDSNLETTIVNMQNVQSRRLSSYLVEGLESPMDILLDDILLGMDEDSLRWTKQPVFSCNCGIERVLSALKMLPKSDIESIAKENKDVEVKCEFCGKQYNVTPQQVVDNIKS